MFTETFPILTSGDLARSLHFYRDLLDGKVTYRFPPEGEPGFVTVAIGSSTVGIAADEEAAAAATGPGRISLWVYAEDCDKAVDRLRAGGAPIVEEPADQPWGERIARVEDPDGNQVIIGAAGSD